MQSNLAKKHPDPGVLPAIGEAFGGGYLAALMPAPGGQQFALIVSPKAEGQAPEDLQWKTAYTKTKGTDSYTDGFANSEHMDDNKHPAAQFCRGLKIGGYEDWYLPASAEQAAIWANIGPNHTPVEAFKKGAEQAYEEEWYWTSTEYASNLACNQSFGVGYLCCLGKANRYRVRAVRKVLI